MSLTTHSPGSLLCRRVGLLVLATVFSVALSAQTKPNKTERRELKLDATTATGGKANTDDPQARALSKLRDQFEVTDDAEWNLIAELIRNVNEFRLTASSSGAGVRGGLLPGDKNKRNRSGGSGRPEQDSLRAALTAKLPDAEIRARLARVHDVHLQNEAKLAKAQEQLRAVLTVRQEAVAVIAGLLPP